MNEVSFKLTDGEMTNVAASHGEWGGYRTTKAMAWVIKIGADCYWLARCQRQSLRPSSFKEAKSQALAMARCADGDYFLKNPVEHLNGLAALVGSMAMVPMPNVISFPLVWRRSLIRNTARSMATRGYELGAINPAATGEKIFYCHAKRQRNQMQKRGIAPETIASEIEALELAIRCEHARFIVSGVAA